MSSLWSMSTSIFSSLTLEYSASVWDPYRVGDIKCLEQVNRRAARVVYNKSFRQKDVSPSALLQELKWEPLKERRQKQRLCMIYKITWGLVAVPPTRLQSPNRKLRGHSKKYKVIPTTCDTVKHSFFSRTIPQWNELNEDTVNASSLAQFKQMLP